ncbi:MAG: hypothetical protein ACTTKP_04630 [Catonella sp.]|uniref:hypothetical protein n=1 Tax=Catonella sp. TaxID=2382125 RepID=UPI003F9FA9EC
MGDISTKKIHISEAFRTSVIAVDNYSSADFSGKLYNPFYTQCVQIRSFQQLIKELDSLMDEIGCPMSGMEKRSFTKYSHPDSRTLFLTDKDHASKGKMATFAIRIQYRNNASWQGTVKWLEGDAEEYFRSVLELFWLIDSALSTECSGRYEDISN